jgi:hypothetical protein
MDRGRRVTVAGNRYVRGETVYTVCRPGGGIEKRRYATVLDVGARGVHVQFDDDGEKAWLSSQRAIRLPEEKEEHGSVIDKPAPIPQTATAKTRGGNLAALTVSVTAPAPVIPAPATVERAPKPATILDAIEADGVNPFAMWRQMGRELVGRAREKVSVAEARVASASRDVTDAESLLALMRASHAEAMERAEMARRELAELERVVKTEAA